MFRFAVVFTTLVALAASAQAPTRKVTVPEAAPAAAKARAFHDLRYGVRFTVPKGWDLSTKDHQMSTFRLDAHSADAGARMRAVASLGFNPFPLSTLSGALFYFSVEPHSTDRACEVEALGKDAKPDATKLQSIGGVAFSHGDEEHGRICLESRDDIYTAFRRGSCYRFDLAVNMFCAEVSGAQEITLKQMNDIESQMAGILSTVTFNWSKTGAEVVLPPAIVPSTVVPPPAAPPSVKATLSSGQ